MYKNLIQGPENYSLFPGQPAIRQKKGHLIMYDLLHLFDALTFKRGINLLKNEFSYYLSRLIGSPVMAGLPWAVSIEPTTSCNLRCPECPSGLRSFTRPTGNMSLEVFKNALDRLSPHLIYLTLYFQGEPLLNRNFIEMVNYAKLNMIYVATSTNGHFLDDDTALAIVESRLDRLIISMDGTDQSTYEKYRVGGNLTKVQQGISNLVSWKKKLRVKHPLIELQFLVLGTNEHQIPEIKRYARSLKVDKLSLKSAQLNNRKDNPFLTTHKTYSRYEISAAGNLEIRRRLPDRCYRMWHSPVITWDGKVLPCCFDKDASYVLGNLAESSFEEIWKSSKYSGYRKKIFSERNKIDICRNCNET